MKRHFAAYSILALSLALGGCNGGDKVAITTSPSETSPAALAPSQAPIPITLPVAQDGRVTFKNATSNVKRIPATAWQRVQDTIATNTDGEVATDITIGPTTAASREQVLLQLARTQRLWSGFRQPPRFTGLVYGATDEAWAESEWPKLASKMNLQINPANYVDKLRAGCEFGKKAATACYGGMAQVFPGSDDGFAFFGVEGSAWTAKSLRKKGPRGPISQVGHEYTHNVQFAQWLGTELKPGENVRSDSAHAGMPCWFSEGQANAIGIAVATPTVASYTETRLYNVTRRINPNMPIKPSLTRFTATALTEFLSRQDPLTCYDPGKNGDYQLGYSVGYAATEVLVAIGGPQSTMALLAETSAGASWADAFAAVYGIPWNEGAEVIGSVLAAEYKANPIQR